MLKDEGPKPIGAGPKALKAQNAAYAKLTKEGGAASFEAFVRATQLPGAVAPTEWTRVGSVCSSTGVPDEAIQPQRALLLEHAAALSPPLKLAKPGAVEYGWRAMGIDEEGGATDVTVAVFKQLTVGSVACGFVEEPASNGAFYKSTDGTGRSVGFDTKTSGAVVRGGGGGDKKGGPGKV